MLNKTKLQQTVQNQRQALEDILRMETKHGNVSN